MFFWVWFIHMVDYGSTIWYFFGRAWATIYRLAMQDATGYATVLPCDALHVNALFAAVVLSVRPSVCLSVCLLRRMFKRIFSGFDTVRIILQDRNYLSHVLSS